MTDLRSRSGMQIAPIPFEFSRCSPKHFFGRHEEMESMKKFTVILLSLLILVATIVPSYGQTRHRSRFGRKARTAAIVAGGAGAGALIGGKKGAAIGAGGAGLYAFNRGAA